MVKEGIEFINAEPGIVQNYLETVERSSQDVNPSNLKIINYGCNLILQVMNGRIKEFPVRRTFLYKLLNWYKFPVNQLYRLSLDTIASVCNDYLMNIKRKYVTIKFEKQEALTLLSPDYNEISDLEVIKSIVGMGARNISRNDFFISITTEDKVKTEPVPGDVCGVGLNIVNSETGFRALSVSHYILRYICSNGAVVKISDDDNQRYHYGNENLSAFLKEKVDNAKADRELLISKLKTLNDNKITRTKEYYLKKIGTVLGPQEASDFLSDFNEQLTQYELFNLITSNAKRYDLSKRYFLESAAGEMVKKDAAYKNLVGKDSE